MADYIKRISHCTFACKDYSAMENFYSRTLGLKKLFSVDYTNEFIEGFRYLDYKDLKAQVGDECLSYFKVAPKEFIELYNVPYNGVNETQDQGFHHICLLVEDIAEAARELKGKGVKLWKGPGWLKTPFTEPYPDENSPAEECGPSFFIQDPEGNEIEIMQYT